MSTQLSPEDEKYLDSLKNLLKISEEHEKLRNLGKKETPDEEETEDNLRTEGSENPVEIPLEQMIEPAERVEPLQSMVEPDYVRKVIRQMDTMTTEQLKQALMRIKVSTGGNKKTLRKRVAQYYRKENALLNRKSEPNSDKTYRYFDYLIAADFECTCVEVIYDYPHEIIELPAVLIDVREMKIVSEFRSYVRPVKNPKLSEFCIQFTKIAQETVDEAPYFREALDRLIQWMRQFGLGEKNTRFAFVTDGPHDMWKFMQFQCLLSNIRMPHMFRNFINIKKTFKEKFNGLVKGNGKSGIENMLERLELSFIGNKHSGLDDARNIAQIAIQMMKLKIELRINQKCSWHEPSYHTLKEDEEIGDHVDLASIDVSRRDFQMWLRRLPLKLSSVTRREFLNEEYLDCESCDELTDDKNDAQSFEDKMANRAEIETIDEDEFNKFAEGAPANEPTPTPPPVRDNEDSESDEEEYRREFEMMDIVDSINSDEPPSEAVELNEIWQRRGSESDGQAEGVVSLGDYAYSTSRATSSLVSTRVMSFDDILESSSVEDMELMAPPPKNSLASTNRSSRNDNY
ncbi:hypothetical protein GCK72_016153 [Caenorhabditis remanei]|uniref:SAP domain-containing protein n=1 Tax=Caenorhabditis remanei TaxID=31234 RepID=A0A6A5GYN3_CAERE|nr:hypothetical protein GCK72_016153 [Caenorhabditis remanei]KAF1759686.1 hypothetical protein GCK72_016153 [Caenorhabditis remanei]